MNADAQARDIHARWHAAVVARDLVGLGALYAEDATFESPAVLTLGETGTGILVGRSNVVTYFETFFSKLGSDAPAWHRSQTFLSNGGQLAWEYPRATPGGDQVDLVEWMDVRDGLIAHHRVYWGWVGLRTLLAARERG